MKSEKRKGINKADKNGMWKGDSPIGDAMLHRWVRRNIGKPKVCEDCQHNGKVDLANTTGVYNRELKNWKYLCRRCHMVSDGRLGRLILRNKGVSYSAM